LFSLIYRSADALRRRSLGGNHGRLGVNLAHGFLQSRGSTVVARNYHPPSGHGETDPVVWHREKLVFVEENLRYR
jgi:Holliday junction resolvase-like predicted endonuclease